MTDTPAATVHPLLAELTWRGQLHQCTDPDRLAAHLSAGPCAVYCGFDPTADSLTIGNLVPIMLLRRFQQHGHRPVVLMGGATGRIGDPSGKDAERALQSDDTVERNIAQQRAIFENLLRFDDSDTSAVIVNNYDWFKDITFIDALRDIGKHFSVNQMIQRDAVKNRLEREEQGISYTEFSYMLLQAYDFLHLYRERGVTIQCAGSDQWGNIVSGVDLIRRVNVSAAAQDAAPQAFGLTAPLLTKADGSKFGKTESGAVWLSPDRTSPYAFYQFWLNADDADLPTYLRIFTDLAENDTIELEAQHAEAPHKRAAQRALAERVTQLVHGRGGLARAVAATDALFSGDIAQLDAATLGEVFADVPSSEHPRSGLDEPMPLADLLPRTSLCSSKREARQFLQSGAVTLNGQKAGVEDALSADRLLHGTMAVLRRGKKHWHVTRWV